MSRTDVLVSVTELGELLGGASVSVLDVRWRLDQPDGRTAYADSHIPGAVYVDLESELSDHSVTGRGRHPLPTGAALQAAARTWGLRAGTPVVVYDDWNRAGSSRAWWVLRAAGISDVRILDGGLEAWIAAGQPLESGPVRPEEGDVVVEYPDLYAGALPTLTDSQVADYPGALIDARAPERFRGDVEPVDAVAGHVPGALNVPSTTTLADGFFRDGDSLHALFTAAGVEGDGQPVGVYCGSGVTAAVDLAALAIAGFRDAALFPGSWSQWSSVSTNPVATG